MAIDQTGVSWTAEELLRDVRQKARIPAGTLDYTDPVLLEEATRAIWSFAGWAMTKGADGRLMQTLVREGRHASPYAPGRDVDLPFDAVGDTFDGAVWYNNATQTEHRLERVQLWDQSLYDTPQNSSINPWGYSLNDGKLRLYPRPLIAGEVRINYQRRLPRLVLSTDETNVRTVAGSSADPTGLFISYSGPDGFLNANFGGTRADVINPSAPYRYLLSNADVMLGSGLNEFFTPTYTVSTTPANNAELQDATIVAAGCSPFVHLPLEFRAALTLYVASQVLNEIGDQAGSAVLEQRAEKEMMRVSGLLTPRTKTTRIKVVNPFSLVRSRRLARWGF